MSRFSNNAIFERILSLDYIPTSLIFGDVFINYLYEYIPNSYSKINIKENSIQS